jgi:hypothetical protein
MGWVQLSWRLALRTSLVPADVTGQQDATRRDAARSLQTIKHQKDETRSLYATAIGWTILIQA